MTAYLRQIWELPFGVRLFVLSESFLGIGLGMFTMLFNLHLLASHVDETQIGIITSVGTVVLAASSVILGYFIDSLGRKKMLLAGLFFLAIGSSGVALGHNLLHFYITYSVYSIGMALLVGTEFPLLFSYCENDLQQTIVYSLLFAIYTLFVGLGTYLGGILPDLLPKGETIYEKALLLSGGAIFIVMILRSFLPKERRNDSNVSTINQKKSWVPNRRVLIFTGFSTLIGAAFAALNPFFNIILKYRLDWSDQEVALLLTLNGLCLFIASLFSPYMLQRWGLARTAILIFLGSIIPSIILGSVLPTLFFTSLFLFRSSSFTVLTNLLEGQMMQATPDSDRSLLSGLRSLGRNVSSSVISLYIGYVLYEKNYLLPFSVTGIILVFAFFYFFHLVLPEIKKDPSSVEESNEAQVLQ